MSTLPNNFSIFLRGQNWCVSEGSEDLCMCLDVQSAPHLGEKCPKRGHPAAGWVCQTLNTQGAVQGHCSAPWAPRWVTARKQHHLRKHLQSRLEGTELWLLLLLFALTAGHDSSQQARLPVWRQRSAWQPPTNQVLPSPITRAFFWKSSHPTSAFPTETLTDEHGRGRACNSCCNISSFQCQSVTPNFKEFCQQAFNLVQLVLPDQFWLAESLFKT